MEAATEHKGRTAPGQDGRTWPELPLGPISTNPVRRFLEDLRQERAVPADGMPPGPSSFSLKRTHQMSSDPLPLLLPLYERYGPIFSIRLLHTRVVFMLGPEANHFVTVGHPELFRWREGSFGDLVPLLGDGLLTTDGEFHDRARRIMVPAFHQKQIALAVDAMESEAQAALDGLRPGETIDFYAWMRELAMRIAMRSLLGLDPSRSETGARAAQLFERALGFYGIDYPLRMLRGPGSPFRKLMNARAELDEIVYAEIARRRAEPSESPGDILSLLLQARGDGGEAFTDREVRDQVTTLMFAGHDTTTSTVSFLVYELTKGPRALELTLAELDQRLGGRAPEPAETNGGLPYLEMVLAETLRLYPPAWIGPRRAVRDFEFAGRPVPMGTYVNYVSWASHRLPDVFEDPDRFEPERFEPERRAALPRGAYVPFGGGTRICIGKRFGETEIKVIAAMLLQRFRLEIPADYELVIRQMPTLSPKHGLPVTVHPR